jgi:hypothetical protein
MFGKIVHPNTRPTVVDGGTCSLAGTRVIMALNCTDAQGYEVVSVCSSSSHYFSTVTQMLEEASSSCLTSSCNSLCSVLALAVCIYEYVLEVIARERQPWSHARVRS